VTSKPLRRPPLVTIGLVGGIASGKSTVARLFAEHGAIVLDADAIARATLSEPPILAAIVNRFGPRVLDAGGSIDRKALAAVVFDDPAARRDLEALIHPRVAATLESRLSALATAGRRTAVVLDVPLLFETGLDALCDTVVFVDTPEALRRERAMKDRGWTADELERREKNQQSTGQKKARADSMIQNLGSIEPLRARTRELLQKILNEHV
jgi:dephospho-CoA kinase